MSHMATNNTESIFMIMVVYKSMCHLEISINLPSDLDPWKT